MCAEAKKAPPPRLVAWEVTRNCNLSCRHCRAAAERGPYAGEMDTKEALALVDSIAEVGRPIIILTGGEPLMRKDIFELAEYGSGKGFRMVLATNGTLLTESIARKCVDSGIQRISISIDGATAAAHDEFRRMPGAFEGALSAMAAARKAGLPFQVNSTVTARNAGQLGNLLMLAESEGAVAWHVFLLVPMGRGRNLASEILKADAYEEMLGWLYDLSRQTRLEVKLTCAPHYYRIVRERGGKPEAGHGGELHSFTRGCLGGVGFCFVSHVGDVQPCGYLELNCGSVRKDSFKEIWQNSQEFKRLRNFSLLKGKCGACEFRAVCGGCRARAYEATGDYMEAEPLCSYIPRMYRSATKTETPDG
jgi:heme b synthase